jgi:hypothetical protein
MSIGLLAPAEAIVAGLVRVRFSFAVPGGAV